MGYGGMRQKERCVPVCNVASAKLFLFLIRSLLNVTPVSTWSFFPLMQTRKLLGRCSVRAEVGLGAGVVFE